MAHSNKEGGKCLAGLELDYNNRLILTEVRPKWIRPICKTEHGQVPYQIADEFKLLSIYELEIIPLEPKGYQSENVLFNEKHIRKLGVYQTKDLESFCESFDKLFGNLGKAISKNKIGEIRNSLALIKTTKFEISHSSHNEN